MTSHSPFDKDVLLQFETGLQEQQRELRHVIEKTEKDICALVHSGPMDAVDLSCGSSLKESMFARNTQIRRQLRLVELALERIRNGDFGICAACEGVIGLRRLQAVPWTSHCLQCQERFEHGKRHATVVELYRREPALR